MSDPFLGEVRCFGFNFAPVNYAQCNGQLMAISQNTALFSILGTNFGGNGINTFGLPNLNGNVVVGAGTGPGLSPRDVGETGGEQYVTLTSANMPPHTHTLHGMGRGGGDATPSAAEGLGHSATGQNAYAPASAGKPATLNAAALTASPGQGQPHYNVMPFLTVNFCIALVGIFPPRP